MIKQIFIVWGQKPDHTPTTPSYEVVGAVEAQIIDGEWRQAFGADYYQEGALDIAARIYSRRKETLEVCPLGVNPVKRNTAGYKLAEKVGK